MKFIKFGQAKQILGIFKVGASKGFDFKLLNGIWIKRAARETNWAETEEPAQVQPTTRPRTRGLPDWWAPPVSGF